MADALRSFGAKWTGFWHKHDPDDVFSYNSLKLVTIRDRYLGLLHHSLQIGILIYIFVYVIFVSKQFLLLNDAQGMVRIYVSDNTTGAEPSNVDAAAVAYCQRFNKTCTFPVVDQIVTGNGPDLFIASSTQEVALVTNCSLTSPLCKPTNTTPITQSIIANLDDLYISIDHSAQVSFKGIPPAGWLQTVKSPDSDVPDWKLCTDCPINHFESLAADVIPLTTLLTAAKLNLDDDATDYLLGTADYEQLPYREWGAVILLYIVYDNVDNYFSKDPPVKYYYRPQLITDIDDYLFESVYTNYPSARTVVEKRGIRFVGILTGQIGAFNFQTLLIQLTTSLALLKVAAVVVDLIAINILPQRRLYKNAKYDKTDDFSDIRKKSSSNDKLGRELREDSVAASI